MSLKMSIIEGKMKVKNSNYRRGRWVY